MSINFQSTSGWAFAYSVVLVIAAVYAVIVMWSEAKDFSDLFIQQQDAVAEVVEEIQEVEQATLDLETVITDPAATDEERELAVEAVANEVEDVTEEVAIPEEETGSTPEPGDTEAGPLVDTKPKQTLTLFWWELTATSEGLYLWLVVAAGALGAAVRSLYLIVRAVESEIFKPSSALWHYARPVLGAGTAIITYFVIRGGILNLNVDNSSLNPYTMVGVSAAVGWSTGQILRKLGKLELAPERGD